MLDNAKHPATHGSHPKSPKAKCGEKARMKVKTKKKVKARAGAAREQ